MIIDDQESYFIFIYHPKIFSGKTYTVYQGRELTNSEVFQYWGKWIILGKREMLDDLAQKFNRYVEEEKIPCIKYDRDPPANLGGEDCVMMVYCDKRQSEDVWDILKQHGIKLKAWVSERETMEMWMPGGPLMESWIESMSFDEATVEAIREDAKARLNSIMENPDDTFFPWPQ